MGTILDRRLIHRGAKFDFESITLTSGSGEVTREIVRHPGAVVVVPIAGDPGESDPELVLIRNRRWALDAVLWEFPAGTMEPPEPAEACAARELEEEAGHTAEAVEPIGSFYTTPGMTDELMRAFVATGLAPTAQRLEADESIEVEKRRLSSVLAMIDRGEMLDAKSILALMLAMRKGLVGGGAPAP